MEHVQSSFLVCNPIVDLFLLLCDGPKLSMTRVCADDFGSALSALRYLRRQASIFRVAARAAGLHLKPAKCILVISGCELTEDLKLAILAWLRTNIPEFACFRVQSYGKYLGWTLGRDCTRLSYEAPINKYSARVQEVVDGQLPAPQAILRYNQRAVPVLSYVAQFSEPRINKSKIFDLDAREHTAIHRVLRFPPKCMSRSLMHDVGFCRVISPTKLRGYCACILFRFACLKRIIFSTL